MIINLNKADMDLAKEARKVHKITCGYMNVDYMLSLTKTRKRECVQARQATMSVLKELYKKASLQTIGNAFKKDHATVIHAKKTINNLCDTDKSIKKQYKKILSQSKKQLGLKPKSEDVLLHEDLILMIRKLIFKKCDIHTVIEINNYLNLL